MKYSIQQIEELLKGTTENLMEYVVHEASCILNRWEAGEPTEDGGYRSKYAGKWYQSKPVDETPKCNCGLDQVIENYEQIVEQLLAENKELQERVEKLQISSNEQYFMDSKKIEELKLNFQAVRKLAIDYFPDDMVDTPLAVDQEIKREVRRLKGK